MDFCNPRSQQICINPTRVCVRRPGFIVRGVAGLGTNKSMACGTLRASIYRRAPLSGAPKRMSASCRRRARSTGLGETRFPGPKRDGTRVKGEISTVNLCAHFVWTLFLPGRGEEITSRQFMSNLDGLSCGLRCEGDIECRGSAADATLGPGNVPTHQ